MINNLSSQIRQLNMQQQDKVGKITGSLCMQLIAQAAAQNVVINPDPTKLEDEGTLRMFKKGVDQPKNQ